MTEATDSFFIVMLLLVLVPVIVAIALIWSIFSTGKNNKSKNADEIE
jgi:cbb3-type cytochrome oxidase subunit 3